MAEQGKCRMCGRPIVWHRTISGNVIPIDPEPSEDGTVAVVEDIAVTHNDLFSDHIDGPRYAQHVTTCPVKKQQRKDAKKTK